ncbi:MAG: hypothetical protein NVV70_14825 [Cellulomonas sp.]|nr:hypothetical protein [Cellulomonas sp.]MCR6649343.1 hypothetical protein [Cellulomonas sp.]
MIEILAASTEAHYEAALDAEFVAVMNKRFPLERPTRAQLAWLEGAKRANANYMDRPLWSSAARIGQVAQRSRVGPVAAGVGTVYGGVQSYEDSLGDGEPRSTAILRGAAEVGAGALGVGTGAAAGAAIGTVFAPVIGTAVGAGVGAVVGWATTWVVGRTSRTAIDMYVEGK